MSILSSAENNLLNAEADRIFEICRYHAAALRALQIQRGSPIDGAAFRLYRADRNIIYRIQGQFPWFLKLPRNGRHEPIVREALGAGILASIGGTTTSLSPTVLRTSIDKSFLLTSLIPGRQLDRVVYRSCCSLWPEKANGMNRILGSLGNAFAQLHRALENQEMPSANRCLYRTLAERLGSLKCPDATTDSLARNLESLAPESAETRVFIHANAYFWNVLVDGERLKLIDFENCGRGYRYDDLANLTHSLVLMRTLAWFPWRRAQTALRAFIEAYRGDDQFNQALFDRALVARIGLYYVDTFGAGCTFPTIAGLPVVRRKLQRLLDALLHGDRRSILSAGN